MPFAQSLVQVLPNVPYGPKFSEEIRKLRALRTPDVSKLSIDILLDTCGVKTVYPPANKDELMALCTEIENSDPVSASRALLYLFLDCSGDARKLDEGASNDGNSNQSISQYYTSQTWMDKPEQCLVRGLWLIDNNDIQAAFKLLAEPCLDQNMSTIRTHIFHVLNTSDKQLALQYLITFQALDSEFLDALLDLGKLAEILSISRQTSNLDYIKLISRYGLRNKHNALELAQLPFGTEEWDIVRDELTAYIEDSSNTSLESELAQKVLLTRSIHFGDKSTVETLSSINDDALVFSRTI